MQEATQRTRTELTSVHAARRRSAYVIVLCCVAAIGGFLFGFDSGVINGTVDALSKAFGTDAAGTGFAVASVLLGCAVGAFGAGRLADALGRRLTMLLNAMLFLVTAIATGAANSAAFFIAARIAAGVAIGAASVLAPMYIAEVAPAHMRGRLASLQQMAIVLGLFSAFLSNAILARVAGGASEIFWFEAATWRWMFWMEAMPAVAFLLGCMIIPESPRYLVFVGKTSKHERSSRELAPMPIDLCGRSSEASRPNAVPGCRILLFPARDALLRCSGWEWVWLFSSNSSVSTLFSISVRSCGKQRVQLNNGLCALTSSQAW
jgi:MFS family permease